MKKQLKTLLIAGAAFLFGNSAVAQPKAKKTNSPATSVKTPKQIVKEMQEVYGRRIGRNGYKFIDERPATTYDASKDFLAYPVKVNYTVDSVLWADGYDAYFQEAIVVNFEKDAKAQADFDKELQPTLVHEVLHFIQEEKAKHLLSQKMAKGLTFEQAYELAMCREVASHVGAKLAKEMNASKNFDIKKFAKIVNEETKEYLTDCDRYNGSFYKEQFFTEAKHQFSPVAQNGNQETFLKLKSAIMSIYVNVDGKMMSVNLLPFLLKENADKIKTHPQQLARYQQDKALIDEEAKSNQPASPISEKTKIVLIQKRYKAFKNGNSARSGGQTADVSAYFPKMTVEEYAKVKEFYSDGDTAEHQKALSEIISSTNQVENKMLASIDSKGRNGK